MLTSCSATKTGAEEERAVFQGGCCSVTGCLSDCGRIRAIAFTPWALSWPTSSLAFILPVPSCSPPGPAAVWMLGCWPCDPPPCLVSTGSLWPQHNLPVSLLRWNITLTLAKPQVLESLIFLLSVPITVNQEGNYSANYSAKPVHSHWEPTKLQHSGKNHYKNLLLANAILPLKLLPPIRSSLWKTVWSTFSWFTITFKKLCWIYESFA